MSPFRTPDTRERLHDERANAEGKLRVGGTGVISWWRAPTFSRDWGEGIRPIVLPSLSILLLVLSRARVNKGGILFPICKDRIRERVKYFDVNEIVNIETSINLKVYSLTNLFKINLTLAKVNNRVFIQISFEKIEFIRNIALLLLDINDNRILSKSYNIETIL